VWQSFTVEESPVNFEILVWCYTDQYHYSSEKSMKNNKQRKIEEELKIIATRKENRIKLFQQMY